eukprot:958823-Rhodomonas_salina.1
MRERRQSTAARLRLPAAVLMAVGLLHTIGKGCVVWGSAEETTEGGREREGEGGRGRGAVLGLISRRMMPMEWQ